MRRQKVENIRPFYPDFFAQLLNCININSFVVNIFGNSSKCKVASCFHPQRWPHQEYCLKIQEILHRHEAKHIFEVREVIANIMVIKIDQKILSFRPTIYEDSTWASQLQNTE